MNANTVGDSSSVVHIIENWKAYLISVLKCPDKRPQYRLDPALETALSTQQLDIAAFFL